MSNNADEFYMVWGEGCNTPTKKVYRMQEAIDEARRLAVKRIGNKFYVLKSIGHMQTPEPEPAWTRVKTGPVDD